MNLTVLNCTLYMFVYSSHIVNRLAKAGTYGGNDMLVAMARLHNVCIVVHQYLEKPWQIEPPDDMLAAAAATPVRRQIHLFYHTNGDHYDSVRMRGDMANAPTQIMIQVAGLLVSALQYTYVCIDEYIGVV